MRRGEAQVSRWSNRSPEGVHVWRSSVASSTMDPLVSDVNNPEQSSNRRDWTTGPGPHGPTGSMPAALMTTAAAREVRNLSNRASGMVRFCPWLSVSWGLSFSHCVKSLGARRRGLRAKLRAHVRKEVRADYPCARSAAGFALEKSQ